MVDFNVVYSEMFHQDKESAERQLRYIKEKFSSIVGSENIDVLEVMDMEVVELKITYEVKGDFK